MPLFSEWQNFYVVIGSAAGALIGLQFVVMALIANMPRTTDLAGAGAAFSTQTIVQFASVLFMAAIVCVPWHEDCSPFELLFVAGAIGFIYSIRNAVILHRQSAYIPAPEDRPF